MLWIVMTLAVAQPVEFNGRLSQTVVFEGRLSEKGGDPDRLRGDDATIPPGHDAPAPQRLGSPAELANQRDAPVAPVPAVETPNSPPASSTTVCQCRGYNEAVCFCLRAGLKCHCSKDIGSVWRVEGGKAVAKTGAKANLNQAAFDAEWDRRVKARQDAQAAPGTPTTTQDEPEAVVTLYSPKSWHCAHCPGFVAQDWSGMPFKVEHVEQDGLGLYPQARWTDKDGVTRILTGAHTPWQVEWSWRRTQ